MLQELANAWFAEMEARPAQAASDWVYPESQAERVRASFGQLGVDKIRSRAPYNWRAQRLFVKDILYLFSVAKGDQMVAEVASLVRSR